MSKQVSTHHLYITMYKRRQVYRTHFIGFGHVFIVNGIRRWGWLELKKERNGIRRWGKKERIFWHLLAWWKYCPMRGIPPSPLPPSPKRTWDRVAMETQCFASPNIGNLFGCLGQILIYRWVVFCASCMLRLKRY